jgi:uncharacterized protein YgiM (DUF1202 family)
MGAAVLAAALAFPGVALTAPKGGATITVRVINTKVMKTPSFVGGSAATVSRGDHLTFKEAKKDWYRVVTSGGVEGWIHSTNVEDKKVELSTKPGGGGGGASSDEIELAGRGFTPEVEQEYRAKHGDLDFSHVDAFERVAVDADELAKFAAKGKVGGAP